MKRGRRRNGAMGTAGGNNPWHPARPDSTSRASGGDYHLRVMNGKTKVVAYVRDPQTRDTVAPYETKFAERIKVVTEANATDVKAILIAEPWVIGDTYEEIVESLSLLGGTSLALHIVQRKASVSNN